jgi:transposase
MDQIHHIRQLFYEQGLSVTDVAKTVGCDWRTARKYIDMEDFSPPAPLPESEVSHKSKLDPFKPLIDQWLEDDKKAPRKQRHTAKRIHDRLKDEAEGYDCSYRLTDDYVAAKKKELHLDKQENYLPLIHHPGESQADFGNADFIENGHYYSKRKYLTLSFPYSNGGYLQLNYGENTECLLEGLQAMFEYIGGVPTEIWFDNTSTIVIQIAKDGGRQITDRFRRFCEHYRFKAIFMNPNAGHEKGNVEAKVKYLRNNELVPVPEFQNLAAKNQELLAACDKDMQREHYDKGRMISDLFEEDRAALLPLPSIRFDTAGYGSATTDKYGRFTLDDGMHRYSASPAFCEKVVQYKLTSGTVTVMDSDMHEIVTHRRLYGEDEPESMDWIPYLKYIARKPRSLRNSGIYELMPESMRYFMDHCENAERGQVLKTLAELTERNGFDSALDTVNEAIRLQAKDAESLKSLHRRLYSDVPQLPPLEGGTDIPLGKVIPFRNDLASYDRVLKGGASNG